MSNQKNDPQKVYINNDFTISHAGEEAQKKAAEVKKNKAEQERQQKISKLKNENDRKKIEAKVKERDDEIKLATQAKERTQKKEVDKIAQKRFDEQKMPRPTMKMFQTKGKTKEQIASEVRANMKAQHQRDLGTVVSTLSASWNKHIDKAVVQAQEKEKTQQREKPAEYVFEKSADTARESSKDAFKTAHDKQGGEKDWRSLRDERNQGNLFDRKR
jgi:hypothetical protein